MSYTNFSQGKDKYHYSKEIYNSSPTFSIHYSQFSIPTNIELPCPDSSHASVIPDPIGNPVDQNDCLAKFSIQSQSKLTDSDIENIVSYQELFKTVLSKIPYHLWQSLDDVTFSFSNDIPRGSANSHKIILRITNTNENEFSSVLIHEIGHIADLGAFEGNSKEIISNEDNENNFISGYSRTDHFEHFAETFLTYVLHGDFLKSKNIDQYNFFKDEIFEGYVYDDFSDEDKNLTTPYDATKLKFDLTGFLES